MVLRHFGTRRKREFPPIVRRPMLKQQGNSRSYIIARCRRVGRTDLAEAIEQGTVSSYAISCEMGWQKRRVLGSGSPNQAMKRAYALERLSLPTNGKAADTFTPGECAILQELWLGPNLNTGSLFSTRDELHAAWEKHRDVLMAMFRPRDLAAYREFEGRPARPDKGKAPPGGTNGA